MSHGSLDAARSVIPIEGRRLQVLVVSDVVPWPARDGYRLRVHAVIDALAPIADVDVFVASRPGEQVVGTTPATVRHCESVVVTDSRRNLRLALRTLRSPLPRRILWRDWSRALACFDRFADRSYDAVWYSHADSYAIFGGGRTERSIVDLDNLEDQIRGRSQVLAGGQGPAWARLSAAGRSLAHEPLDARDRRGWARLQRSIADTAAATVVCSTVDRDRLGGDRVVVIPNGYADPGEPDPPPASSRRLVLVGRFTYEPNLDAVAWLVTEILPRLRLLGVDAEIRLIGRHDERLTRVLVGSGIEVAGEVDDIAPELRSARGVIVPVRTGSGTRIKILEAFAYGRPVVTTTAGCEGIALAPGRDALVCDDAGEFARAMARLLDDDVLCSELGARGRRLFERRYEAGPIGDLTRSLVAGEHKPERPAS